MKAWGACAILVLALASCKDDTSGGSSDNGLGASTPLPWVDTSFSGAGGSGDTPLLWNDPETGPGSTPPNDASDIRTYTAPDIYMMGNRHPLMTHVTSRSHPNIIPREDRVTQILNDFRFQEYVRIIGYPLPPNARLSEALFLRQNARAHAKHYAVWFPGVHLPLVNHEGDSVWYSAPIAGPGIERLPNLGTVTGPASGRLPKSKVQVDEVGQLVLSGTQYWDADTVGRFLIATYPDFLRHTTWSHMGVGYWSTIGSGVDHYWNVICARNPRSQEPTGTVTLPGWGF